MSQASDPRILEGMRLKFRDSDDGLWLTATVWIGDRAVQEIARIGKGLLEDAPGSVYQDWVDVVGAAFNALVSKATGLKVEKSIRRRPDYTGERRR